MNVSHPSKVLCPSNALWGIFNRGFISCDFLASGFYPVLTTVDGFSVVARGPAIPFAAHLLLRLIGVPEEVAEGTCLWCQFSELISQRQCTVVENQGREWLLRSGDFGRHTSLGLSKTWVIKVSRKGDFELDFSWLQFEGFQQHHIQRSNLATRRDFGPLGFVQTFERKRSLWWYDRLVLLPVADSSPPVSLMMLQITISMHF